MPEYYCNTDSSRSYRDPKYQEYLDRHLLGKLYLDHKEYDADLLRLYSQWSETHSPTSLYEYANSANKDDVVINKLGGKQSKITGAYHLLPALAIEIVSGVLQEGADNYEKDEQGNPLDLPDSINANWRKISIHSHLCHAIRHIFKYLQRNTEEDHLGHAACRLLFALEIKGK